MQLIVPGHILHFFESVHEVASPSNEEQEQSGLKDSGSPSIGETSGIELEKQFIDSKTMGMEEYFEEILLPVMRLLDRLLERNKLFLFVVL